jgi:putative flippase GtrA
MIEKCRQILVQFVKYFGVALVGYLFDFGILFILNEFFHVYYLIAAASGFIIGLIITFFLSNRFVFGESKIKSKSAEFGFFAIIGVIGLGILTILMWFFTDVFLINYLVSKVFATVFVYIWNFFARRSLYNN